MKYIILVPDGCADEPIAELDGKTPLAVAVMPHLAALAQRAEVGRAQVIPAGLPPGSDVGHLSILGYDPIQYHTGRAPIEAAAMGIEFSSEELAFRCNLVTITNDIMVDFAGGHPTNEQSHAIVAALNETLGGGRDGVRFYPGVEYRHICIVPKSWCDVECIPPHDLTGMDAQWPVGPAAGRLKKLMDASIPVVTETAAEVGSTASQIWLWGQGTRPQLPSFAVSGRLSSAVDLVRGLGVLADIEVLDVPGASAGFNNDYRAQRDACLESLKSRDFFLLHVEATDEAGHQGEVAEKIKALESWDQEIIGPLVSELGDENYRILLLPDHATPCALRTHTSDPVPYLLFDSQVDGSGGEYTEVGVANSPIVVGHDLLGRLLA